MICNKSFNFRKLNLATQNMLFASIITFMLFTFMLSPNSFAEPLESQTIIIPINDSIAIEKTTTQMHIAKENTLPWGFVEGVISNPVFDYPVIIQIFDNDDIINGNNVSAVHFAQTTVNQDGSYEYKFRVLDSKNTKITKIFDGSYTVKIFKVVYIHPNLGVI